VCVCVCVCVCVRVHFTAECKSGVTSDTLSGFYNLCEHFNLTKLFRAAVIVLNVTCCKDLMIYSIIVCSVLLFSVLFYLFPLLLIYKI